MTQPLVRRQWFRRFLPRSFRTKFVLVVGAAVLFDLVLAGGIAIWNVERLSRDATNQVGEGLTEATRDYLETYIETTSLRADQLLGQMHSEVGILANAMQTLIDHPETQGKIGEALDQNPAFSTPLTYDAQGGWLQNQRGAPSAVSVWGYLLGPDRQPLPDAQREILDSAFLGVIGPAMMKSGAPKLQLYYVGPKKASILRSVPYSEQGKTFDRLYPGHNQGPNFWDFFFPGLHDGWKSWLRQPADRPVNSDIVTTAPYIDAISGRLIVSFFHPLWTGDRADVGGMVAADMTLNQLANLVESVTIAKTGFGFLAMSNGNVLVTGQAGEQVLGLVANDVSGQGVMGVNKSLANSRQPAIAALHLPTDQRISIQHIRLKNGDEMVPYLVMLKQLRPTNLWDGTSIVKETMTLGFVVSEREIYASLIAAQDNISQATTRIINYQIITFLASIGVVLVAVFSISGRITAGLSALAQAARRLEQKDYSVRVDIPSHDEVGAVGHAFNRMAGEISYHTENLERLVEARTRALESANAEISALNGLLASENLRMGAELDVARQIQMMVLPTADELAQVPQIEIAGYMRPADEVGGDYYDVLQDGGRVKIGIGDVTGHGLESGVLMLMVQSVARGLHERGSTDPIRFLNVLNRTIFKNIGRTKSDKHLSLAFLDYEDRQITLSGQHEEVLLLRAGASAVERLDTQDLGFPIGLEPDIAPFILPRQLAFESGDLIALYTDGVTEAESATGELFGTERLCASLLAHRNGTAEVIVQKIIGDLMQHIGAQKVHDDITLLILRHR